MKKENETADVLETEKSGKKKSRLPKPVRLLILIVGTIVGALAITTLITLPYLKGDVFVTHEGTVRVQKYGDYEDNDRWRVTDTECCGIECRYLYNPGEKTSPEEYMKYLKFSSKSKAKKAFALLKEQGYYNIEEEGDNYFVGWKAGVEDAAIEEIVCLSDNMIVSAEIYEASEWARSEDDTSPSSWEYPERKQFVMDNFVR